MLRFPFRNSPVVAVLVAANISTLFLLFSPSTVHEKWIGFHETLIHQSVPAPESQESIKTETIPLATRTVTVLPATLTVTSTTTTTATVEVENPPPKPPGPAFCDACGAEDPLCAIYGEHNLARSRVYEGANARFRRVISDALAGKQIKIGVLGGSVTKGHGLVHGQKVWTMSFLEAWEEMFPKSKTVMINGAVPATGSDYFSMCFGEHLDEDMDLIIIELLINDQRIEQNAVAYEWLLRGLLELPRKPAVINLHTIGLFYDLISTGGDLHTPVAEYYDVPTISVRNMVAPHLFKNPDLEEYYFFNDHGIPDLRHVSLHGHRVMAEVLVAYTQRQLCAVEREKAHPTTYINKDGTLHGTDGLDTIPRIRLLQKYDNTTVVGRITPSCQSIRTDKHPLVPFEAKGWERWVYKDRLEKPYLVAREPGAYAKFHVEVGVMQRVRITYLKSKTFGLGNVWCWIDDDRNGGMKVEGWWPYQQYNIASVWVITDKATPGKHVLTCEVMQDTLDPGGGHEFRLIAVDAS